jgi:hypothetical protein
MFYANSRISSITIYKCPAIYSQDMVIYSRDMMAKPEDIILNQRMFLPDIAIDILLHEEELGREREIVQDEKKRYIGAKGMHFYAMKGGQPQDCYLGLTAVLDKVYCSIEQRLEGYPPSETFSFLSMRRDTVEKAILRTMVERDLTQSIIGQPEIIIDLVFGELSYVSHPMHPVKDKRIVLGTTNMQYPDRKISNISINGNSFIEFTDDMKRDRNCLSRMFGHDTHDELIANIVFRESVISKYTN